MTNREQLMTQLIELQNELVSPIDILTITGFMTDEQLKQHVERYVEASIKKAALIAKAEELLKQAEDL